MYKSNGVPIFRQILKNLIRLVRVVEIWVDRKIPMVHIKPLISRLTKVATNITNTKAPECLAADIDEQKIAIDF